MLNKMNNKGMSSTDLFYTIVGVLFIAIGIFLLYFSAIQKQDEMQEKIKLDKEGYQTLQLARTYLITPMEFKGETKTVAQWANDYFLKENYKDKTELKSELYFLGLKILSPHLKNEYFPTKAEFNFYVNGKLESNFIVANSDSKITNQEYYDQFSMISDSQEEIKIQIPTYKEGSQDVSTYYLVFEIKSNRKIQTTNWGPKI